MKLEEFKIVFIIMQRKRTSNVKTLLKANSTSNLTQQVIKKSSLKSESVSPFNEYFSNVTNQMEQKEKRQKIYQYKRVSTEPDAYAHMQDKLNNIENKI